MILGEIRLDHARQQVAFRGWSANLTRLELKLMSQLMTNHGQVLKRGELLDLIWGLNTNITARSIDSHVARLRHKLGVLAPYLQTVRSVGFRLSEEIASAGRERDERIPELHRLNFHFKRTRRIELIHARGNESPADLAAA
jgi:two-component system phosphate regulon response regulator PhoB